MVAIMLYLDRVCLSILGTSIKKDLDFNEVQFANLLSAFFWAYALCQIPAGWIGDRYGPRIALGIYLFFWSLCTGLMGMVSGYGLFLLLRLGCGLFEAGAYPLANGIVRKWVPLSGRGTASGIVAIGGRLGGAIAPMLTNFLAAGASDGWRKPFIIYGLIGMVGAIIFWVWYRDEPSQHPLVNQAEIDLINGTNHVPDSSKPGFPNFVALATNLSIPLRLGLCFGALRGRYEKRAKGWNKHLLSHPMRQCELYQYSIQKLCYAQTGAHGLHRSRAILQVVLCQHQLHLQ